MTLPILVGIVKFK